MTTKSPNLSISVIVRLSVRADVDTSDDHLSVQRASHRVERHLTRVDKHFLEHRVQPPHHNVHRTQDVVVCCHTVVTLVLERVEPPTLKKKVHVFVRPRTLIQARLYPCKLNLITDLQKQVLEHKVRRREQMQSRVSLTVPVHQIHHVNPCVAKIQRSVERIHSSSHETSSRYRDWFTTMSSSDSSCSRSKRSTTFRWCRDGEPLCR